MKIHSKLLGIVSTFIIASSTGAGAAEPIQLDDNGKQTMIQLAPGSKEPLTFYVQSKGNLTQFVTLKVQAPNGTKVTAASLVVGKAKAREVAAKNSGWVNASFMTYTGSETANLVVGGKSNSRTTRSTPVKLAVSSDYYCGNATVADLDQVIQLFLEIQGVTYTRDQLCALYGFGVGSSGGSGSTGGTGSGGTGGYGGGSVSYGSSTSEAVQVLVRKDTCAVKPNAVYVVKFDLNFSGVSPDVLAQGAEIYVSATPIQYSGSKASSLKPTSDGKFAPKALFLMASTGGWGSEKMTLVKWSKNKPSLKTLKVEDMVYWRGHSLARIVAEPVLRGGNGVAELQSNVGVYSVCFRLVKSRQKYNGYS